MGITKRRYNKNASSDKAYEIYLRSSRTRSYVDRDREYLDPLKWSIGDLRREKVACRQKISQQYKILEALDRALMVRGYPKDVRGGGC